MAESTYHGKSSEAYFGSAAIENFLGWSVNLSADAAESSVVDSTDIGKTRETGHLTGTATVNCRLPGDRTITEGSVGTLELLRTGANADGGYASAANGAMCISVEAGADMGDVETLNYTFQFTGEVSNTVTEGTA
jgi:hypothetical protein